MKNIEKVLNDVSNKVLANPILYLILNPVLIPILCFNLGKYVSQQNTKL